MTFSLNASKKTETLCHVAVESLETHEEPESGAHRAKGSKYLTTHEIAKQLQDENIVRIVGVF